MLLTSIISLIVSIFIQGTISNVTGYTFTHLTIFYTVYPVITLIVLLPYFRNHKKYIVLLLITGLIVDIAYTNTFILNTLIFIVIYYFNKAFFKILPYNLLMINISSLISIIIYHTLTFLLLLITSFDTYTIGMLLTAISHSILMTIMFTSLLYILIEKINDKLELKEVR